MSNKVIEKTKVDVVVTKEIERSEEIKDVYIVYRTKREINGRIKKEDIYIWKLEKNRIDKKEVR
jgi:hypothetical protein